MALKEFKDYPNTETPIDAKNLNFNFNELDQKIDDEVTNNTQIDYTTGGAAVKCGYQIDGKDVYVKRIFCETFPNNTDKTWPIGIDLSKHTIIKIEGYCKSKTNNVGFPLPFSNPSNLGMSIMVNLTNDNNINVTTGIDRSAYDGWFNIYFIERE